MKFPIILPNDSCIIQLQIWDRDMITESDFIADVSFGFKELANECFMSGKRLKMRGGKDSILSMMKKSDSDRF
jgi:hypothetical protein